MLPKDNLLLLSPFLIWFRRAHAPSSFELPDEEVLSLSKNSGPSSIFRALPDRNQDFTTHINTSLKAPTLLVHTILDIHNVYRRSSKFNQSNCLGGKKIVLLRTFQYLTRLNNHYSEFFTNYIDHQM